MITRPAKSSPWSCPPSLSTNLYRHVDGGELICDDENGEEQVPDEWFSQTTETVIFLCAPTVFKPTLWSISINYMKVLSASEYSASKC